MERYEEYVDKWLLGIESEISFWKRYMETEGDIHYENFKNHTEKNKHFTLERHLGDFSGEELIKFIDIGSGPFSRCGCISEKYNLQVEAVDPLAEIYNRLKKDNNLENGIIIQTGFVELLDQEFDEGAYDIVHMSNSLDHSFDAVFGIYQLLRLCKIGGKVILRHAENEAERSEYGGLHQWNLSVHNEENSFVIWRKDERYDIKKMLAGYANVEWEADVYENKWKYNEVIITKLKNSPITDNPYKSKLFDRVYSFLLKVLINSAGQKDNSLVIRNRDIIRKIRESEIIYRNISRLADKKIDIYGLGVVGKELIEYCEKNGIRHNIIWDKQERNYKDYKSVSLETEMDVTNHIVIVAVMRDYDEIKQMLKAKGYHNNEIYRIEDLL